MEFNEIKCRVKYKTKNTSIMILHLIIIIKNDQ